MCLAHCVVSEASISKSWALGSFEEWFREPLSMDRWEEDCEAR